jgi:hypothetical protein
MKTKQWVILVSLYAIMTMFFVGIAEGAGVGTLTYTFKYQNPTTGTTTNLTSAYIYLHNAANPPPLQKFFSRADFIDNPSNGSMNNGSYVVTKVPAGTWYIRITQRQGAINPLGPPQNGDYTWFQTSPITIVAGQTLNLGTLYATPFGTAPITITGIVTNSGGIPLVGRYVRATITQCLQNENCDENGCEQPENSCGPVVLMAMQPTDSTGRYTLLLQNPGTYYISTFSSWDTTPGCDGYCPAPIYGTGYFIVPVTATSGANITLNITGLNY